jgi:adenylate cyclase
MVEPWVEAVAIDDLTLKGFNRPVLAMEIVRWRDEAEAIEAEASVPLRRKQ